MFRKFLNPDNPLMIVMTQITDCVFLSFFWVLLCFPVVTIGPATAALYDATFRCFRQRERHPWHRFFHSFKQNLKTGIPAGVVFTAACVGMVWGLIQVWNAAVYGQISWMVFSGVCFLALVVLGILSVLLPMLSRFENSLGRLFGNTLRLAMANLPRTILLGVLNVLTAVLCARWIYPLFFLPSLSALLASYLIEPMFKPYLPEQTPEAEA